MKTKVYFILTLMTHFVMSSQLYVKENSEVSTKGQLSSKELINNFQSDISGAGELYFSGEFNQELITKKGIRLPEIGIHTNSEFYSHTHFFIDGDLTIDRANVFCC